jgi:hypothetical protein
MKETFIEGFVGFIKDIFLYGGFIWFILCLTSIANSLEKIANKK